MCTSGISTAGVPDTTVLPRGPLCLRPSSQLSPSAPLADAAAAGERNGGVRKGAPVPSPLRQPLVAICQSSVRVRIGAETLCAEIFN